MTFQYWILEWKDTAKVAAAQRGKQDIGFSIHFAAEVIFSTKPKA